MEGIYSSYGNRFAGGTTASINYRLLRSREDSAARHGELLSGSTFVITFVCSSLNSAYRLVVVHRRYNLNLQMRASGFFNHRFDVIRS